jgi:hypothetical protein
MKLVPASAYKTTQGTASIVGTTAPGNDRRL